VDRIRDRVAGLDVHRDTVVACLRLAVGGDVETVKRSFSTMSAGVTKWAAWLGDPEVGTVVMEVARPPEIGPPVM
jgi:transposase